MPPWEPSSRVPPPPPQRLTWRHLDAGDMLGYVQAIVMLFKENLLTHDEVRDALGQLGLTHPKEEGS